MVEAETSGDPVKVSGIGSRKGFQGTIMPAISRKFSRTVRL